MEFDAEWFGEVDHKRASSADVGFGSNSEVLERYQEKLAHKPVYIQSHTENNGKVDVINE
jgi:hypothetical protein